MGKVSLNLKFTGGRYRLYKEIRPTFSRRILIEIERHVFESAKGHTTYVLNEERIIVRKPSVCIHCDKHSSCVYELVRVLQAEVLCYHSPSTPTVTSPVRPADGKGYRTPRKNEFRTSTIMNLS